VNFWVQKEILSGKTMKSRGEVLAHFIKVAKVSVMLSDVESCLLSVLRVRDSSLQE